MQLEYLQGSYSADRKEAVSLYDNNCFEINGEKTFQLAEQPYTYYMAKACVLDRENDVCSQLASMLISCKYMFYMCRPLELNGNQRDW